MKPIVVSLFIIMSSYIYLFNDNIKQIIEIWEKIYDPERFLMFDDYEFLRHVDLDNNEYQTDNPSILLKYDKKEITLFENFASSKQKLFVFISNYTHLLKTADILSTNNYIHTNLTTDTILIDTKTNSALFGLSEQYLTNIRYWTDKQSPTMFDPLEFLIYSHLLSNNIDIFTNRDADVVYKFVEENYSFVSLFNNIEKIFISYKKIIDTFINKTIAEIKYICDKNCHLWNSYSVNIAYLTVLSTFKQTAFIREFIKICFAAIHPIPERRVQDNEKYEKICAEILTIEWKRLIKID